MTTRAVAWSLLGVSTALAIIGGWLNVVGHPTTAGLDYDVSFCVAFLGFSIVGAIVASHVPRNPVGWLLLVQGLCWELAAVMAGYANYTLVVSDGSLPAGEIAAWAVNWLYVPALGALTVLALLFPDGRLPSRRWLPVMWLTVLAIVLTVADSMFAPGPLHEAPSVSNPFGLGGGTESMFRLVRGVGDLLFTLAWAATVLSLVFRFRSARGVERQQLKWLAVAGCVVLLAGRAADALDAVGLHTAGQNVFVSSLLAVPLAVGIATLRYRLYDIDLVINKTVVLGGLALFITAVYVATVVGIGAAVGRGLGSNLTLAAVATAVVAVAFDPVRRLLHRTARRFVFGAPKPPEEQAGVAIKCLGAFRVFRDGDLVPFTAWQSRKARTVLKILVARRGRTTHRDYLMEALWPDEDPTVVTRRLSVALATVRAVLDPDKRRSPDYFVPAVEDTVRLDLAHVPVDIEAFMQAASEGLALDGRADAAAKAMLTTAANAYAGDFLDEDPYEEWAIQLRDEARVTYVSVLHALARLAENAGAVDETIRHQQRILDLDPWDEAAHVGIVRVMERAGRHGEARRYFNAYASRMNELGVPVEPFPLG